MRGCNYSCTYCIVPYVRGREIYHPLEQILARSARSGRGRRARNYFARPDGQLLPASARIVSRICSELSQVLTALSVFAYMSPHPYYMTDAVIETMAKVPAGL